MWESFIPAGVVLKPPEPTRVQVYAKKNALRRWRWKVWRSDWRHDVESSAFCGHPRLCDRIMIYALLGPKNSKGLFVEFQFLHASLTVATFQAIDRRLSFRPFRWPHPIHLCHAWTP